MIKNVIFDLDGVLWELDFEKLANLIATDLEIPKIRIKDFVKDLQDVINELLTKVDVKINKELIIGVLKQTALKYSINENQLYDAISNENYNFCNNNPKALHVVESLHEKGYKLFVKTNWFENVQMANLRRNGYLPFFDKVIGILDDYLKPNLKSLDKIIEDNSPQDFIIIGDTPKKEMKLANLLGIESVWLNKNKQDRPQEKMLVPTYEIQEITGVLKIL